MQETPPEMSSAINRLIALFSQAETEITKSLMGALSSGAEGTAIIKGQRRGEIKTILAHLLELAVAGRPEDPAGPAWDVVRAAYTTGAMRAAQGAGLSNEGFGGIHLDTARVLFENLVDALRNAVEYVGRKVDDEFRKATLEQTLQGVVQGSTRKEQSAAIAKDLSDRGVKAFRDKTGREWSLANYAAMAARTTAREAHTRGTVTRLAENGLDLVKISDHVQDELDICTKHEGKIYSISGSSDTYPSALGNLPPYHPNCKHVATPFVERFADALVEEPVEEMTPAVETTPQGRELQSVDEAEAWGADNFEPRADLDPDERQALDDYVGSAFGPINGYLRGTRDSRFIGDAQREKDWIANIDPILERNHTPEPVQAFRAVDDDVFGDIPFEDLPGQEFTDKGYMSTSVLKDPPASFGSYPVHMTIDVPTGTPAYYVPNIYPRGTLDEKPNRFDEQELLLGRGQNYRVTSAEKDANGKWQIRLEVLSGDVSEEEDPFDDPFNEDFGENEPLDSEEQEMARYEEKLLRDMDKAQRSAVFQAVIEAGGLQTRDALREEYSEIPNTFKRRDGLPGDVMAEYLADHHPEFGIEDERDLIDFLST